MIALAGTGSKALSTTTPEFGPSARPRPAWRPDLRAIPWSGRLAWSVAFAVAAAALVTLYMRVGLRTASGADGQVITQQSWDWLHGNPLLRGWFLPDITFYTIEIPEFALIELIHGALTPVVLQIGEALNLTLFVLLAALAAKGSAAGWQGVIRALVAAGILFVPTPGPNNTLMLGNPDHLATQVPMLVVWIILDRAKPRWWVPVTVAALLAWARVSDAIVLLEGETPLLAVCVMRMAQRRGPLRGQWYDMSLAFAAVAAEGIAQLALLLVREAGGFSYWPLNEPFGQLSLLGHQLRVTGDSVLLLYGANLPDPLRDNVQAWIPALHLVGVLLAAVGLLYGIRRIFSGDLMVQVLTMAGVASLAAYTLLGNEAAGGGAHDLMPVLPIGAVLAGRLVGDILFRVRRAAVPVLVVWVALSMTFLVHDATVPVRPTQSQVVAAWLRDHHLRYGLTNYYAAALISVDSGSQVMVAPINRRGGQLVLSPWNSTTSWYDPASVDATFFVANHMQSCPNDDAAIWLADARRAFGPPAHVYSVDGAFIAIWQGNLLLGHLKPVPPHRPSPC